MSRLNGVKAVAPSLSRRPTAGTVASERSGFVRAPRVSASETTVTETTNLSIAADEREELVRYARGRRLVIDYVEGTFGCGGIAAGDVYIRWLDGESQPDDRVVPATGLEPVTAFVRREARPLIDQGVFRVAVRGRGPFRKPILLLVKHRAWLEFLGNVPLRG